MIRVELSDREFNRIQFLDNEATDPSWDYARRGGCGSCNFKLPGKFFKDRNIAGDFNINLYRRNAATQTWDKVYQGLILNKIVDIASIDEAVMIKGQGYQAQLKRIYVDRDYSSTEVSVIVKHILDSDIVPNTDITYDDGDIEATSFTPDSMEFNVFASEALQTLADLVNYEWGVDKDRKYYFKAKSSTIGHRFVKGKQCRRFYSDDSSQDIVNRVIIKGGDVGGSPYSAVYNDTNSQLKWGRRDYFVQNTAITTNNVAEQYANAIFNEKALVVRKGTAEIINPAALIEAAIPIPLFQLVSKGVTYGERKYGTFVHSGIIPYQINKISYGEDFNGMITATLDLGHPAITAGRTIAQIEKELEQIKSEGL